MKDTSNFGADEWNRTITPLRELEPKSKLALSRCDERDENQRINNDALPPVNPTSRNRGHTLGTVTVRSWPVPTVSRFGVNQYSQDPDRWVHRIFHSRTWHGTRRESAGHFRKLRELVEARLIDLYQFPIEINSRYPSHEDLVAAASDWYRQFSPCTIEFEKTVPYGRCDLLVTTPTVSVMVECGISRPSNCWRALESPSTDFMILPFPHENEPTLAYRFRRGPNFPAPQIPIQIAAGVSA